MRTLFEFTVEPRLPEALAPAQEIAYNLWWTWNPIAIDLFRRMDDELWERSRHNPVLLFSMLPATRLEELSQDRSFVEFMKDVHSDFRAYMDGDTWYSNQYGRPEKPSIVYFSMEFGLTECLRLYSGGLGVLAGDHLKSARDLGLPLVGVGSALPEGLLPPVPQRRRLAAGALPDQRLLRPAGRAACSTPTASR